MFYNPTPFEKFLDEIFPTEKYREMKYFQAFTCYPENGWRCEGVLSVIDTWDQDAVNYAYSVLDEEFELLSTPVKHRCALKELFKAIFIDNVFQIVCFGALNFDMKKEKLHLTNWNWTRSVEAWLNNAILHPVHTYCDFSCYEMPIYQYFYARDAESLGIQFLYCLRDINLWNSFHVQGIIRNFRMDNPVKFLRLPDGGALTVKKAIEYLHRKEATTNV